MYYGEERARASAREEQGWMKRRGGGEGTASEAEQSKRGPGAGVGKDRRLPGKASLGWPGLYI